MYQSASLVHHSSRIIPVDFNVHDESGEIDSKELKVAMRALGFEPKKAWCARRIADVANHDWLANRIRLYD